MNALLIVLIAACYALALSVAAPQWARYWQPGAPDESKIEAIGAWIWETVRG